MMNTLSRFILVLLLILSPAFALAQSASAGIPKDLIWFSKSPFYAGETVYVYTVVYNSTPYQFAGTMELRDGLRAIGKQEFSIGPSGASEVVGIPWKVTSGNHDLSMFVMSGTFSLDGKVVSHGGVTYVQSNQIELFTEAPPVSAASPTTTPSGSSATSSLISSIGVKVVDKIPAPIVSTAVPVFGHLEQFRINQALSAAKIIHNAEESIVRAMGTSTEVVASSTGTHLDKWGGVIDDRLTASSTIKTPKEMKGWDLILHGTSGSDLVHTPIQYVKLFFTLIFSFIINHAVLFYVLLILLIYKTLRVILGLFF